MRAPEDQPAELEEDTDSRGQGRGAGIVDPTVAARRQPTDCLDETGVGVDESERASERACVRARGEGGRQGCREGGMEGWTEGEGEGGGGVCVR